MRVVALVLAVLVVAGCGSSPSRQDVEAFLDANYAADPGRSDTWRSAQPVQPTADKIAERVEPRDRFAEQQATFMRDGEYIVAVFPEASGSRVELDTYDRARTRYLPIIGGYWGPSPTSYGPRGERASSTGGGFRGGGPGSGK